MQNQQVDQVLRKTIQTHLLKVGVVLKNINNGVRFDSEEACLQQHNGDWETRLISTTIKFKANTKRLH